jgi:hypothetical protein
MRRHSARQMAVEAEALRRRGTEVLLLEPTERDVAEIGANVMDARRARRVAETALATTAERLRKFRRKLVPDGTRTYS